MSLERSSTPARHHTPLGRPRVHIRATSSTNDRARELALGGAPHGTLVTASEQTAGRGRQGRTWSAPPNTSLLMSLVVRWDPARPLQLLPLRAGVAVCDAVASGAWLKWPNDIVTGPSPSVSALRPYQAGPDLRKLGGILMEGRPQEGWAVVGIGLNVAVRVEQLPAELRATAASLGLDRDDIEPLLGRLLRALERRLSEPASVVLDQWRARDALEGAHIEWAEGSGRAQGIDDEGRLVVELDGGTRVALTAGEVHLSASPAR